MTSRRDFIRMTAAFGAVSLAEPFLFARTAMAQAVATVLNPKVVPQFQNLLANPLDPAFIFQPDVAGSQAYTLSIQQFVTNTIGLRTGPRRPLLNTTVWGYGTAAQAPTFPGRTFEVASGTPITVTYENNLTDAAGNAIPHRLAIDTTLDWANPGGLGGLAPVPLVAHLHGGDTQYLSDGLPDAWGTPDVNAGAPNAPVAGTVPDGVADYQGRLFSVPYTYDNSQEAGHLWYHDHALGITRQNVYMGLAGNYFIRDANEAALATVLPKFPFEVPLVIQDRQFLSNGELFYPTSDPALYPTAPNPTHLPEFFGDVVLVNGQAWPRMNVARRQYRFRVLNGSDSRHYELRIRQNSGSGGAINFLVIGNDVGLLNAPVSVNVLPIAPGERYDIVVDFSPLSLASQRLVMTNTAGSPYPNGAPPVAGLTDRIMAFDVARRLTPVVAATVKTTTNLRPVLGPLPALPAATKTRRILLVEGTDGFGRLQTMMGTVDPVTDKFGVVQQGTLVFKDPITEMPVSGQTEIWEFYNTTVDAHPIHMHLVDFRVIGRQAFTATLNPKTNTDGSIGGILDPGSIVLGASIPIAPWEAGRKDTVRSFPGQVTRVQVNFKRAGEYVYHCHILSHEDHEMMRAYEVL
jgi:spore coat protein A, manganese oxidase